MSDSDFFRVDLDGNKIWLPYLEIHFVRRDILLYFDENVGDPLYILMPNNVYELDYWKYLSIGYDQKWAESERYSSLIESGCLVLVNGIAQEILYEPASNPDKVWRRGEINSATILPYLHAYVPSNELLAEARSRLIQTFTDIDNLTIDSLDRDGQITSFDTVSTPMWFDKNIIQAYFNNIVGIKVN